MKNILIAILMLLCISCEKGGNDTIVGHLDIYEKIPMTYQRFNASGEIEWEQEDIIALFVIPVIGASDLNITFGAENKGFQWIYTMDEYKYTAPPPTSQVRNHHITIDKYISDDNYHKGDFYLMMHGEGHITIVESGVTIKLTSSK